MQPNFRASTGYGKAFLNAGNGEWGTGIMQHDITDGVKHLVDEGIADPEQVAIMGASVRRLRDAGRRRVTPDLYAAGVSIVGPSNIITLLNSIPPYWGPTKQMFMRRVGDPDDEEEPRTPHRAVAVLPRREHRSAAAHHSGRQRPAREESRVGPGSSSRCATWTSRAVSACPRRRPRLQRQGEPSGDVRRHRAFPSAPSRRSLPARDRTEVSAKLRALRVDIDDVEMPSADDGEFAEVALDGSILEPAALTYRITWKWPVSRWRWDTTVERSRTTRNDEEVWRVATTVETPMGQAYDVAFLRVGSLGPVHRAIDQGPISMSLDFTDEAITGAVAMQGGNTMDVDMSIEGAVLATWKRPVAVMHSNPGSGPACRCSSRACSNCSKSTSRWSRPSR